MKKYFLYILVLFITENYAQEVLFSKIKQDEIINGNKTELNLNFNNLKKDIRKSDVYELEIQPINDCLKGVEGATMFEPTIIDLKKTKEITINYTMVRRKCLKWRVKTVINQKISFSEWNFHTLVR